MNHFMSIIRETNNVINYGIEGCIVHVMELLAEYKRDEDFEFACKCISETPSPNESYREINYYLLTQIIENRPYIRTIFNKWHIRILILYI